MRACNRARGACAGESVPGRASDGKPDGLCLRAAMPGLRPQEEAGAGVTVAAVRDVRVLRRRHDGVPCNGASVHVRRQRWMGPFQRCRAIRAAGLGARADARRGRQRGRGPTRRCGRSAAGVALQLVGIATGPPWRPMIPALLQRLPVGGGLRKTGDLSDHNSMHALARCALLGNDSLKSCSQRHHQQKHRDCRGRGGATSSAAR